MFVEPLAPFLAGEKEMDSLIENRKRKVGHLPLDATTPKPRTAEDGWVTKPKTLHRECIERMLSRLRASHATQPMRHERTTPVG